MISVWHRVTFINVCKCYSGYKWFPETGISSGAVSGLEEMSLGLLAEPVECEVCTGLCQWPGAFPRATVLRKQEERKSWGKAVQHQELLMKAVRCASVPRFQ